MGHRGDHEQRRHTSDQEPAAEQPRIRPVHRHDVQPPAQRRQPHQPDQRAHVEHSAAVAQRPAHHRRRSPDQGEGGAEQQARSTASASTGTRRPSSRCTAHPPASTPPASPRTSRSARWGTTAATNAVIPTAAAISHVLIDRQPAPAETDQPDHRQRPQQVELLLHRQATTSAATERSHPPPCTPARPRSDTSSTRTPTPPAHPPATGPGRHDGTTP